MEPSQTALAEALNTLVDGQRVVVTETRAGIAVNQLNGAEASAIVALLEADRWTDIVSADAGGEIPPGLLPGSGGGIRITATRPEIPAEVDVALTKSGLSALLDRDPGSSTIWVHGLQQPIETWTVRYAPWGDDTPFVPFDPPSNPARVVRVLGPNGPGVHFGRWLLRAASIDVSDSALAPWRLRAAARLGASLAQEVEPDGRLLFRGPPPTRFACDAADVDLEAFAALQEAVNWTYENGRELENRHGLIAAEVARTSLRDGRLTDLAGCLSMALEGARIAYGFGVTQQSKDTLKALGDLRKAVSDDAAKLSETTRSLGTAVVGAVFGNIGLIVARLTLPANGLFVGPAAILLGVVLALYVVAVIVSGAHYISIQRSLRKDWRTRLYRFLGDAEYKQMVSRPAERAETAFYITAGIGIAMTVVLLGAVYFIAVAPPMAPNPTPVGAASSEKLLKAEPETTGTPIASSTVTRLPNAASNKATRAEPAPPQRK